MSKGNPIPQSQRDALSLRSRGQCEHCGGRATDVHHRRSRAVRDDHTHCLCVLIHLCRTCHNRAHASAVVYRDLGLIVPRHVSDPWNTPFLHWSGAKMSPTCVGMPNPWAAMTFKKEER